MDKPRPLFCLFLFFSNTNFTEKTVHFCTIRTLIVGVEGKHADHLTTTTAHQYCYSLVKKSKCIFVLLIGCFQKFICCHVNR